MQVQISLCLLKNHTCTSNRSPKIGVVKPLIPKGRGNLIFKHRYKFILHSGQKLRRIKTRRIKTSSDCGGGSGLYESRWVEWVT
jgi:hypothetical protein